MSGHTQPCLQQQAQKNPCGDTLYSPPDRESIPPSATAPRPTIASLTRDPLGSALVEWSGLDWIGFDLRNHRSVGLGVDDSAWVATTSTSNRNPLQENDATPKLRARC